MGWSIGFDSTWNRDIGHGVPAYCDHPGCGAEINRGLAYVCDSEQPYGGDGCGLYFCPKHLGAKCSKSHRDLTPTRDHPDWIAHKLKDESWQQWRDENSDEVARLEAPRPAEGGAHE